MNEIDIAPYLKGMDESQVEQIQWASEFGLNEEQIKIIANIEFNWAQMNMIVDAFRSNLSMKQVAILAKPDLNDKQMLAICEAFESGLTIEEVSPFAKPELNPFQSIKVQNSIMKENENQKLFIRRNKKSHFLGFLYLLLLILSLFVFSINAESNILSLSTLQKEPPKAKMSLVFNHDDTLINVSGALVRKKDAMNLFSSLYQKKTGNSIQVLDVFTTSNKQFLGCITLSQGNVDVFFTNGIEIFNKEASQSVLGVQSSLAIDYYEGLLKGLNKDKKETSYKQEKKATSVTKEEERLLLFGQIAKKGLPLATYFQYGKHNPSKKSVFIFVSHTCPNCIQYINTYFKHQDKFDAIANIKWVPIGSINNRDWAVFFKDESAAFTKDEIERNQNIILSMNTALKKQTVTPTNLWLSKTVVGGVALVTGGLGIQDLDKVEKDLADINHE